MIEWHKTMADSPLAAARIRYNYVCGYCGVTEISTGSVLTLDHYQPKAAKGVMLEAFLRR